MTDPEREPITAGRQRRGDAVERERRSGSSPLATWTGARLVFVCLLWLGIVALLVLLGILGSIAVNHSATEVRSAFTRGHIVGLLGVVFIPPAALAYQWYLMRGRRRGRRPPE